MGEASKPGRQTLEGVVTSTKMQKTIVVRVERRVQHPVYKKIIKRHKTYLAHDAEEKSKEGDLVRIGACRPLSKRKCWELLEITKPKAE